jgi:hypothetical protein
VILWYCIGFSVVIVHSIRLPLTFIVDLVDTPILLLAFLIVQSCIIHISIVEQLLFPLTLINTYLPSSSSTQGSLSLSQANPVPHRTVFAFRLFLD